jgi:hypothetical protein
MKVAAFSEKCQLKVTPPDKVAEKLKISAKQAENL